MGTTILTLRCLLTGDLDMSTCMDHGCTGLKVPSQSGALIPHQNLTQSTQNLFQHSIGLRLGHMIGICCAYLGWVLNGVNEVSTLNASMDRPAILKQIRLLRGSWRCLKTERSSRSKVALRRTLRLVGKIAPLLARASARQRTQSALLTDVFFRAEPNDGRHAVDSYSCTCGTNTPGWGGENCEDDLDECLSRPCTSGSTCHDSTTDPDVPINAYRCSCPPGYAGGVCAYAFLPQYNAACTVQIGGNCAIDVDECISAPCRNGATCTDSTSAGVAMLVDIYSCSCVAGFTSGMCKYDFIAEYADLCSIAAGGNCNIDVNECASSPCENSAACAESAVDSSVAYHDYTCTCTNGYTNGLCTYNVISYYSTTCADQDGNCDLDLNECISSPCLNGATCTDSTNATGPDTRAVSIDAFSCACAPGWMNGVCSPGTISGFEQLCSVWEGGICDEDIDECSSAPCHNGSLCTESTTDAALPSDAYRCTCLSGFANGMCAYAFIAEYATLCTVSVNGNCGIDVDECASNPCQNNALCTDSTDASTITIHSYRCTCVAGYANGVCSYDFISQYSSKCAVAESTKNPALSGNCDIDVDECASSPCLHGSDCRESIVDATISLHAFQCKCVAGYADGSCNYTVIPQYVQSCEVLEGGKCGVDVNECASNPCINGAACADSQTPFVCSDLANFSGPGCNQWLNSDAYTNSSTDAYSCRCTPGWANGICSPGFIDQYFVECTIAEGGSCDVDINECSSDPCLNGAVCKESSTDASVAVDAFRCNCKPGWANGMCATGFLQPYKSTCFKDGALCDMDIDECGSNPCKNPATCTESITNSTISIDAYSCSCPIGWANGVCAPGFIPEVYTECTVLEGGNCDLDINECLSSPCLNGAICMDSSTDPSIAIDSYSCSCSAGWVNGICPPIHPGLAADYVDNCLSHHNNSKTSDTGNCDFGINECTSNPCERGSICDSNESAPGAAVSADNFSCACLPGWANGVCAPGFISEYHTECTRVNGGVCDMDIDECASSPCLNGATCTDSTLEPVCAEYGDSQCCEDQLLLIPIFVPQRKPCAYLSAAFVECSGACVPEWDCSATSAFSHLTLRLLYGMHCNESLWRFASNSSSSRRSLQSDSSESWSAPSESGSSSDSLSGSESGSWIGDPGNSEPIRWSAEMTVDASFEDIMQSEESSLNLSNLIRSNASNLSNRTNESVITSAGNDSVNGSVQSVNGPIGDTTAFERAFRNAISSYLDNFVTAHLLGNGERVQPNATNLTNVSNSTAPKASNNSNATAVSSLEQFAIRPEDIVIDSITAGSVVVSFYLVIPPGDYAIYAATEAAFADLREAALRGNITVGLYSVIAMSDVGVTRAQFTFDPCQAGTYQATPASATTPPICYPISQCNEYEYEHSGPTATSDRLCIMCNSTVVSTYETCRGDPCREPCAKSLLSASALASRCNSTAVVVIGWAADSFTGMLSATNALIEETGCGKSLAVCPRFCREYQRAKRDPVPWRY
eukprot:20021_1